MLIYYFNIWQEIENAQRGSIWQQLKKNAPLSAKMFIALLVLSLFALVAAATLKHHAVNVQLGIVFFDIVLSFAYVMIERRTMRKYASIDLEHAIAQVEPIRRKFMAQASLASDKLYFILDEVRRFSSIRREDRKIFTGRAYEALVLGVLIAFLVKLFDFSGGYLVESSSITLILIIGFATLVLMSFAGPLWDVTDALRDIPSERLNQFIKDLELMIMIEKGCKPCKKPLVR